MNENSGNHTSLPWKFFGLTFLLTWACWFPAGLLPVSQYRLFVQILHYLGGLMPTFVALLLLYLYGNAQERKDYWQRLIQFKRIGKDWYVVVLLMVPVLTGIAILIDLVLGGRGAILEAASNFIQNPLSLIPFAIFMLLFGPLPEEMAWRGYVLDGLQARWNALVSSLILGIAWTLWHLPLFLIEGSYQYGLGLGTPQFWLYMLDKVPQTILMVWIYNNNRRSTISAILFHFMVNFLGELFALSLRAETIYIASYWIIALLVIVIWKPQRFMRVKLAA